MLTVVLVYPVLSGRLSPLTLLVGLLLILALRLPVEGEE